jgi:hypothetical protein
MGTEVVKVDVAQIVAQWEDPRVLTERIKRMLEIQKSVMKKDVHYGVISGCKQNSLFQSGSQILSVAFKLGHEPYKIDDLSSGNEIRYRVTDRVFLQGTDITIGYGIGECSSSEEKYAWKRSYIDQEFDAAIEKKIKFYKNDSGKVFENKMIRTNPSDVANTILKMARKRANVNGTIEALAASEIFTQDIEDLPEGLDLGGENASNPKAGMAPPMTTTSDLPSENLGDPNDDERKAARCISHAQEKRLYAICKSSSVDPENVKNWIAVTKKTSLGHFHQLSWATPTKGKPSEYDRVCETVEKQPDFYLKYATIKVQEPQPVDHAEQAGPTTYEEFELDCQAAAESNGKTLNDAIIELCNVFSVKNLSEIPVDKRKEAIKHLANEL